MSIYDNAGVVLIPSGTKASTLYSVLPANGDGDFTHSRGSTATRVNKDGFIESVAANVPRLDYPLTNGVAGDCPHLLLEPSRTNDIQRTEEFDNAYWTKYNSSVTANQVVSPDGSVTADRLIENTVNTQHEIGRAFSFTSGTTYAVSVFAKTNGRNLMVRAGNTNTWQGNASFDLTNGTVQSTSLGTASIEDFGNGWYRCTVVGQAAASASTNINFRLVNGTVSTYAGDGSSGVYLWGVQREIGSYPTSYIPWDGSGSTTRSVDACNGSGTSAEFNDSEGVLFIEGSLFTNSGENNYFSIGDTTGTRDGVELHFRSESSRIRGIIYSNNSVTVNISTYAFNKTNNNKIAFKYKDNDFAIWVNGTEAVTASSGAAPLKLSTLQFADANNSNIWYGKCKQVLVFKTALTDSELQTLTS